MNRAVLPVLAGVGALAITACGSAAAGTTTPKTGPSPTPRGGALRADGAAGQLVQIKGHTLILSNANGDTTVTYTDSTTITQTSTATFADIAGGECLTGTGTKDSSGQITASMVTVRNATSGGCSAANIFGPGGGPPNGGPTRTPNPNRTPNPQAANFGRASGLVTAVNGTSVTVQEQNGTSTTITVPTTVRVARTDTVDSSALQNGECIAAIGSKASNGSVQARALTIVPAGPGGCSPGVGGGFGGRGGGGFFGGGGGGGGGGGASGTGGTAA